MHEVRRGTIPVHWCNEHHVRIQLLRLLEAQVVLHGLLDTLSKLQELPGVRVQAGFEGILRVRHGSRGARGTRRTRTQRWRQAEHSSSHKAVSHNRCKEQSSLQPPPSHTPPSSTPPSSLPILIRHHSCSSSLTHIPTALHDRPHPSSPHNSLPAPHPSSPHPSLPPSLPPSLSPSRHLPLSPYLR